jgi:hypothetical protein
VEAPLATPPAAACAVAFEGSHAAGLYPGHDPEDTAECASP